MNQGLNDHSVSSMIFVMIMIYVLHSSISQHLSPIPRRAIEQDHTVYFGRNYCPFFSCLKFLFLGPSLPLQCMKEVPQCPHFTQPDVKFARNGEQANHFTPTLDGLQSI